MGALTAKTKAFQSRNWELKEYQTVSLSDPFFSPIKVDVRDRKILRILPVVGTEEWISDNTRFFTTINKTTPNTLIFPTIKNYIIEKNLILSSQKTHEKTNSKEIAKTIAAWAQKHRNLVWITSETTDARTLADIQKRNIYTKIKQTTTCAVQHTSYVNKPNVLNLQEMGIILFKENAYSNEVLENQLINHHRMSTEILSPTIVSIYELLAVSEGTLSSNQSTTMLSPSSVINLLPSYIRTLLIGATNQALAFQKARKAQIQSTKATFVSFDPYIVYSNQVSQSKLVANGQIFNNQNLAIHLPCSPIHGATYANFYGRLINAPTITKKMNLVTLIKHTATNETV